jgi:hypothetical protein
MITHENLVYSRMCFSFISHEETMKCVSVQIICGVGNSIYKNITDKTAGLAQTKFIPIPLVFLFWTSHNISHRSPVEVFLHNSFIITTFFFLIFWLDCVLFVLSFSVYSSGRIIPSWIFYFSSLCVFSYRLCVCFSLSLLMSFSISLFDVAFLSQSRLLYLNFKQKNISTSIYHFSNTPSWCVWLCVSVFSFFYYSGSLYCFGFISCASKISTKKKKKSSATTSSKKHIPLILN